MYDGSVSGALSSWFGSSKPTNNVKTGRKNRHDDLTMACHKKQEGKEDKLMWEGHGNWLSHILIEGKEVWNIEDKMPAWSYKDEELTDQT